MVSTCPPHISVCPHPSVSAGAFSGSTHLQTPFVLSMVHISKIADFQRLCLEIPWGYAGDEVQTEVQYTLVE